MLVTACIWNLFVSNDWNRSAPGNSVYHVATDAKSWNASFRSLMLSVSWNDSSLIVWQNGRNRLWYHRTFILFTVIFKLYTILYRTFLCNASRCRSDSCNFRNANNFNSYWPTRMLSSSFWLSTPLYSSQQSCAFCQIGWVQPDQYGLFFSPLQCIPIASRTCCARSRCASCYPLLENIRNHAKVPYVATVTSRQRHLSPRQDNMAIEEPSGQSLITWHLILNNRRVRLISEPLVHVCKWIHYTLHACMNDNVNLGTLTVFGIYTNGS